MTVQPKRWLLSSLKHTPRPPLFRPAVVSVSADRVCALTPVSLHRGRFFELRNACFSKAVTRIAALILCSPSTPGSRDIIVLFVCMLIALAFVIYFLAKSSPPPTAMSHTEV